MSYTDLFSGRGFIYATGQSGVFPPTTPERQTCPSLSTLGVENVAVAAPLVQGLGWRSIPANGQGYGTFLIEITSATGDNVSNVLVGGVNQISGTPATTLGDLAATAATIAAAINSNVSVPDTSAIAVGEVVHGRFNTPGSGHNGEVVQIHFSGASTAITSDVSGGRSAGQPDVRIFLDTDPAATASTWTSNRVEITDWLANRGLQSPRATHVASVIVDNTLTIPRLSSDTLVLVDASGTVDTIVVDGQLDGDRIELRAKAGRTVTISAGGNIQLSMGTVTLDDPQKSFLVGYDATAVTYNDQYRAFGLGDIRDLGIAVPAQPGVFTTAPSAGTMTLKPGLTGTSAFPGNVYEHDVALTGGAVALGASLEFTVDSTSALQGDRGTVSGGGVAITLGANEVNFITNGVTVASLTPEIALSGQWTAFWVITDLAAGPAWTVSTNFSTLNTQFITAAMLKDLNVTGAKIAAATIDGNAKLIDDSVTEVKLDTVVRAKLNAQGRNRVTIPIASAQVLTLNSVPVLAIPSPGAGYAVLVEQVTAKIAFNSAAYATNTNLQLLFSGAGEATAESATFLTRTANGMVNIPLMYSVGLSVTQILENAVLYIRTETGDATAGNSDIVVYIDYSILQV